MLHFEQRRQGPYHDGEALIVDAKIVDWWLEEMGVLFEPENVLWAVSPFVLPFPCGLG